MLLKHPLRALAILFPLLIEQPYQIYAPKGRAARKPGSPSNLDETFGQFQVDRVDTEPRTEKIADEVLGDAAHLALLRQWELEFCRGEAEARLKDGGG
jgi:hypothetical protein